MRINGHAALACKTKMISMASEGETIQIEPMNNMPVIKDLVTDMAPFWSKIRQVQPWLQPQGTAPKAEYTSPPEVDEPFNRCHELYHVRSLRFGLYGLGRRQAPLSARQR